MRILCLGIAAFVFYYLYDLNTVYLKTKIGRNFFMIGSILLVFATGGLIMESVSEHSAEKVSVIYLIPLILFFVLEIYTLFFALPAQEAYSGVYEEENRVYRDGMYALCRHPGVLWFAGFYISLAGFLQNFHVLTASCVFTMMDVLYIVLQDLVIFPIQFSDYEDYRKTTPFLFPTKTSVRKALAGKRQNR